MKLSLLCSVGLLMAAPLMAQSDDTSVNVALDLLQQSQTQAAAGNLEAAAELAATAQALLRGEPNEAVDKTRRHLIHGERLHEVPEGSQVVIDADGNVTFGGGGEMRIIQIEGGPEVGALLQGTVELQTIAESGCSDENCDDCEECDRADDADCQIDCEIDCEDDGNLEIFMGEMGMRSHFPGLPGRAPHDMQGGMPHAPHGMQGMPHAPQGMQGGGDVHMQLQAVQLELQALRLELQALRMQMGAMRGGMENRMGGGMGGPMGLRRAPHAQSFGDHESIVLRELHSAGAPNMMFLGKGGDFDFDIEELHSLEDFDFDIEELRMELEGEDAAGAKIHSEIKLIHNGKTYEGEEARQRMKELGLGDMGGHIQMRVGLTPPTPPTPPKQRVHVREAHDHEDL